ncbi:MAG: hypothetical protein J2P36_18175 [Ktedonobacteraceae bacterium]|nr:hypothetical protein [Ktedonobacteraceae bacterium]
MSDERMKIGRYQSQVENGHLKLYRHEFGKSSGFFSSLSPEETLGLLQLLQRHRDDIYEAVNARESSLQHVQL